MGALRPRPWWWLVAATGVAIAAGVFALAGESVPWLVLLGFAVACASPAAPLVARWWEARRARTSARLAVLESSALLRREGGPSSLLSPDRQVVPFQGRTDELQALVRWCEGEGVPLRLVTGPGGVGKSRLAAELKELMARDGWECVAVGEEQEATVLARVRSSTNRPVLLIVDYADTRHELDDLVRQVAAEPAGVRVLLIARSAGEWWQRLKAGGPQVREMIQSAYDGTDLPVRVDTDVTDDQIVEDAAAAFAQQLGIPAPEVRLSERGHGRILDLHAASLVAVLRAQPTQPGEAPLAVDVFDVLADLLEHEQRHWIGTAEHAGLLHGPDGLTVDLLRRIVAAVYLTPPADEPEAVALLARVDPRAGTPRVLGWLRDLYPPRDTEHWIGTLQPDRLAELHLVTELTHAPALAGVLLDDLDGRSARHAIAVLARAVADHFSDQDVRDRALHLLDHAITALPDDLELLQSVSAVIPYPSEVLTRSDLSLLHSILGLIDPADTPARSWVLHDIGMRQYRLGRHTQAIQALTEAVDLRRQLAGDDQAGHSPQLAASLRYLGVVLSELGRAHDALSPTLEAVQIEQQLARTDRRNHLPHLARTLCDLGTRYHEAGLPDQAIAPLQESVTINEHLLVIEPERTRPHLARSLMNLAIAQNLLGHPDHALPAIRQTVEIRRILARENPDGDLVFLARALTELSSCLLNNQQPHDAIEPGQESVQIRRRLAEANPERHTPDLARSLRQTAHAHRDAGHPDQAVAAYREAISIERLLVTEHASPGTFTALAESLAGYAALRLTLNQPVDALSLASEAARLVDWHTTDTPPKNLLPVARSLISVLTTVADALDANGQPQNAQARRLAVAALQYRLETSGHPNAHDRRPTGHDA
ncbi:tetratricopeptide repeat protein [Promicromonospora sp. AC04]|uniref:tetratricopeptide repeat protein n=1 Tax=Promicromonospora sp. AC04 TaxID=2135723 RepID=UPI0013050244|nr:tetratricopeptide repeat protein [Promicromonospora sp. AC04]